MKKQLILFVVNTVLIFALTGAAVYFMPSLSPRISTAAPSFAVFASPDAAADTFKSKFSFDIERSEEQTTNNPDNESAQVMHPTGAKDSDDSWDITATPKDIKKLMKQAKKSRKKSDYTGKTTEAPYLGGGKVMSWQGVEIQSKIPDSFYKPDIKALLKKGADLKIKSKDKPVILIYHSHTTESYALLDEGYYIKSDARSKDSSRNMVRVGDELVRALEHYGFKVIHDTKIHDLDYNSSYDDSRVSIEKYLEKYPSVDITIDVHRDAITYSDGTKVKPTATVDGKKCARMMLIAGCEYGMVKNYPDWEYNLRFDLQVQNKMQSLYSGVMRPILFSQRKYNMYETRNSFLLEIGTDANTLDEACYSARLFGTALAKLLDEKYVQ